MTWPAAGTVSAPVSHRDAGGAVVSRRVLAAVLIIVALSAVVRLYDLGRYAAPVFDEYYYAHDAARILAGDLGGSAAAPWRPAALRSAAHPDLGKLAIAAGIAWFGDGPWGRRVPAALAGTALIALVFPLARRMGLTPEWALAALVLAASDPMLMLESRLAVLDTFVALGTAVSVYLALRYVQSGFAAGWLVACGAALGAAVASKWSGLLAVPAALLVIAPALVRRRGAGRLAAAVAVLAGVALAVYFASSAAYFAGGHGLGEWARLQEYMATFGWGVHGDRSFASAPATWPFLVAPIWYSWSLGPGGVSGLLAVGDLVLWWSAVAAWVVLGLLAVLRRDARLGLAPALVAVLYLPWLLTDRQSYIYYMVPVVPFMAVLVATALARLCGSRWDAPGMSAAPAAGPTQPGADGEPPAEAARVAAGRRAAAWAFCAVAVVVGVLYLPFVLGVPVPYEYYDALTPFTSWK